MRKVPKLLPNYCGPFKVIKCIGFVAYKLELLEDSFTHPILHVSHLCKHLYEQDQFANSGILVEYEDEEQDEDEGMNDEEDDEGEEQDEDAEGEDEELEDAEESEEDAEGDDDEDMSDAIAVQEHPPPPVIKTSNAAGRSKPNVTVTAPEEGPMKSVEDKEMDVEDEKDEAN